MHRLHGLRKELSCFMHKGRSQKTTRNRSGCLHQMRKMRRGLSGRRSGNTIGEGKQMSEIRLNIDGIEVKGHQGETILEISKRYDVEIPTLCFDERMDIYGSCGMCVVEVEG